MKRKIIKIDEDKCDGCGVCIPNCPEGALQIIDGKARLIGDLFCDGLGACLGECPVGAIEVEEREAEPYNEAKVMENIVKQGAGVIAAHLKHLKDHGETAVYDQAVEFLQDSGMQIPDTPKEDHMAQPHHTGCPGAQALDFGEKTDPQGSESGKRTSQLTQWPVQLHLVSPNASYFQGADVLLSADCVAYALGDFHKDYLKGRALAIACPKLDDGQEVYTEKLRALIDEAKINTLTVMIMQVPCCHGLMALAQAAAKDASRKIPVKSIVVGIHGEILKEEWVSV